MHDPQLWLALLILLAWLVGTVESALGSRTLRELRSIPPVDDETAPSVSVVIAARDEERNLEEALRSVLSQRYPRLEVVVVDDRSTDRTGEILDAMARRHPHLRVVHLTHLPAGWLGKNHALTRGAEQASGEWLLFTDADVVMEPSTLARAVEYASREGVDHLTLAPDLTMPGPLLDLFGGTFGLLFAFAMKPWKARDPASRRYVGVGAFNLVRAAAYRRVGGHAPIALRPDDDIKLGKLLKRSGCSQDVVLGREMVSVEWYRTLREVVLGLEKNTFAALGYSVTAVLAASLSLLLFAVWPFAALLVTSGAALRVYAATALLIVLLYAASTRGSGTRALLAPGFPLAVVLFVFILLRSTLVTLRNGGIRWRGTFYPLSLLRSNRI